MQGLTQPELLLKPFAQNGTKNTIPVTNTDTANPQKADLTSGFPAITSMEPNDGGLPPERADFNGLGYLTTTYDYFAQAGGKYTFNQTVSTAIGGYPLNARLWYFNGTESQILRSTKNNNDDNFVSNPSFIGTSWVKDTPTMTDLTTRVPASIGSIVKPVYTNANGTITASNATVGSSSQPVYMNNGTITALTGTIANNISGNAATVTNGVYTTGNQTIGGTKTFSNTISGNISGNAATATKLGTSTVGSGVKPIYLNGGTATASNSTVGGATQPVYMNGGSMTACTSYASFLSNWARNGWSTKTLLTSGPQGGGDITLSQPYTNFDALMVVIQTDDYTASTINILTRSDINFLMSFSTSWTLGLGGGEAYWTCLPASGGSTSTLFKTGGSRSENCVMSQIYGVNF